MKRKSTISLWLALIFLLILAGCRSTTELPAVTSTSLPTPTPVYEPTPRQPAIENASANEVLGELESPVPLGSRGRVGYLEMWVRDMIFPATDHLMETSPDIPAPGPGMEYILIDLADVCIAPPTEIDCYVRIYNMRLMGSSNTVRKPVNFPGFPLLLYNHHMRGGIHVFGYVAFIVERYEEDFVFFFESESGETVYLATN